MPKFEIELELQGLKLKVKGDREDMPMIQHHLREQFAGLFQPATGLAAGELPPKQVAATVVPPPPAPAKKRVTRPRRPGSNGDGEVTPVLSWSHDPAKWGNPRQAWTAWQKILWLLYVVDQELKVKEMSGPAIAETFNTHFRQAKLLNKGSMPRDLGALKQRTPALVSDHAEKSPITWFLTEQGIVEAQKMITEAKSGTAAA